jgi:hypothetical protein
MIASDQRMDILTWALMSPLSRARWCARRDGLIYHPPTHAWWRDGQPVIGDELLARYYAASISGPYPPGVVHGH